MLMSCGSDTNVVCGEIPSWSAAASTNGLNDEPGCRSPWTARLNWLSRKLRPPYMASTRPSRGSIATSAADGMPFSPSTSCNGAAREVLEVEVDRRRHLEPAAEHLGRPVRVDELLLHVLDEVGGRPAASGEVHVLGLRQRRVIGRGHLARGDHLLLVHEVQHGRAPGARGLRVDDRVVEARVGGDPGEERRLGERQLVRLLVEVDARGHLDAVGAVPEEDGVQVRGQDPVFRPLALELPGERGLLELAADRPVVAVERVLHELLRDRGASLDELLRAHVGPDGAPDAADVDAAVLPEPPVLDRDDRVLHPGIDLVGLDEHSALVTAQPGQDGLAVGRIDEPVLFQGALSDRAELRNLARDRGNEPVDERDAAYEP